MVLCVMLVVWCVLYVVVGAWAAVPHYQDDCGCLLICRDRYDPEYAFLESEATVEDKEMLPVERAACQKGCLLYHGIINEPDHIHVPSHIERQYTRDKCIEKCKDELVGRSRETAACEGGCRDGCLFFPNAAAGRRPSMKLTIVVEESIHRGSADDNSPNLQDKNDLDVEGEGSVLRDPALKQQIEDTQSPADVKSKIPSTYFTNLPVPHHPHPQLCGGGEELEVCDGWMFGEPVVCAALLILAAGLLIIAYYNNNNNNNNISGQTPPLPHKLPQPSPTYTHC